MCYLGLDIGTSGLRAVLLREDFSLIGVAEATYQTSHPRQGWSEQDPQLWIVAMKRCVAELSTAHPEFTSLKAIGVTGQMQSLSVLDEAGNVLRPSILWNDTRAGAEAEFLEAMPDFAAALGNTVLANFAAPRLEWIRRHEPEIFARVAKILMPTGFLNFFLTGHSFADHSDSSGTSWLDFANRQWSEVYLSAGELSVDQMPKLGEGGAVGGVLRSELKKEWNISGDVIVAFGAGDNAAAACGIGALEDGDKFLSLGTSGVLLKVRDRLQAKKEGREVQIFAHTIPDRWLELGVTRSAGNCMTWLSALTGTRVAELFANLGETLQRPGSVNFSPYLMGGRDLQSSSRQRGAFSGLTLSTVQSDLARAILEGVTIDLRTSFEDMKSTDWRGTNLMVIGGGTLSHYWLQLIATMFNIQLDIPEHAEFSAAIGAAKLGISAATGLPSTDIMQCPAIKMTVEPDKNFLNAYNDKYHDARSLV